MGSDPFTSDVVVVTRTAPRLLLRAGNFYPVNIAYLRGGDGLTLAVVTDRAQGGSSINDGELQVVVQLRLLFVSGAVSEASSG